MNDFIERLGARALQHSGKLPQQNPNSDHGFECQLPPELLSLLEKIGGPVVFEQGANFIPCSPSGRENSNGHLSLDVLYGLTGGVDGLATRHSMTRHDLPSNVTPIGEAPGGGQICLELGSGKIAFWKHDVSQDEAVTEIAKDMVSSSNHSGQTQRWTQALHGR